MIGLVREYVFGISVVAAITLGCVRTGPDRPQHIDPINMSVFQLLEAEKLDTITLQEPCSFSHPASGTIQVPAGTYRVA